MYRTFLSRTIAALFGLFGMTQHAAGQVGWEDRHLIVDDMVIAEADVYKIIDPLWWTVNIYEDFNTYERSLSGFSRPQRLVFAVMWYRSEVNNGGHDQFFFNATGIVWKDALEGLQDAGLEKFADVLTEATNRFANPPSLDRDTRIKQLETAALEFDDLDTRFYDLEEEADMDSKLIAYIRNHRMSFYFNGIVRMPKRQ